MKTNKILVGLLAVVIILSTALMGCIDRNGVDAKIALNSSDNTTSVGGLVYVDVWLEPNQNISGVQFNMRFNPDVFSCHSVLFGNSTDDDFYHFDANIDNEEGTIEGFAFCTLGEGSSIDVNGSIATVVFFAMSCGSGTFELYNVIVGNEKGKELPVEYGTAKIVVE